MSELVSQLGLIGLPQKGESQEVPLAVILKQPNLLAAVNLCINVSGKDDKAFCHATGIDPGNFSAMRKGIKHFPANSFDRIMEEAGNKIPLIWLAHKNGFGLIQLRDEKDRVIAQQQETIEEQAHEIKTLYKVLGVNK